MTDIDAFAAALIDAHRHKIRVALPDTQFSRADCLAVQARVSAALGPVAGFKVGQSPDGPPIFAPIPACYRVENGGSRYLHDRLGIELEVGFELLRPLPSAKLPDRPQAYFRPHVVLELADSRVAGAFMERADVKFADLQLNSGFVIGDGLDDWDGSDFGTLTARLGSEHETILSGRARVPDGSALASLDLLISHLGAHCGGLQVGQTVITGSLCGLPWFTPDALVAGRVEGLGAVSVNLRQAPDEARGKA